jgi:glycosyltransferase involved in cell wall biosynthesis
MAKPSILIIFYSLYNYRSSMGGAERRFLEIIKRWKSMGIRFATIESSPSFSDSFSIGYKAYTVKTFNSSKLTSSVILIRALLWFSLAFFKAIHVVRREKIDVIFTPIHSPPNVLISYLLAKIFHKPFVVLIHAPEKPEFERTIGSRYKAWRKRGFGSLFAIISAVLNPIIWSFIRRADGILTVSKTSFYGIVGLHVPSEKIYVSTNGVAFEKLQAFSKPINAKEFDCAFLGRLLPEKGLSDLIKAWKLVIEKFPRAKLVVIGGGYEDYVKTLKDMVEKLGMRQNVIFTGFLRDEDAYRYLGSSKVFAFLSHGVAEGFPLVIGEAMACGLPVVAYNLPAIREAYRSESVILVALGDIGKVAQEIINLLEDDERLRRLGEVAREYAKTLDWRIVAERDYSFIAKVATK